MLGIEPIRARAKVDPGMGRDAVGAAGADVALARRPSALLPLVLLPAAPEDLDQLIEESAHAGLELTAAKGVAQHIRSVDADLILTGINRCLWGLQVVVLPGAATEFPIASALEPGEQQATGNREANRRSTQQRG